MPGKLLWLLPFFVLGCATAPPVVEPEQAISSAPPHNWHARGRFAWRGDESRNGQFDWRQHGDTFEIRLFGTFGLGATQLNGDNEWVEITSGEDTWYTNTPDLTLFQLTGMPLPVNELSRWITGRTGSDTGNWQVRYADFRQISGYQLPTQLELTDLSSSLRVLISEWSLDDVD